LRFPGADWPPTDVAAVVVVLLTVVVLRLKRKLYDFLPNKLKVQLLLEMVYVLTPPTPPEGVSRGGRGVAWYGGGGG